MPLPATCIGKLFNSGFRCVGGLGVWFYSEMGDVTSLSGPIVLGLGDGRVSDVVPIAMRNYHIIASNIALESPSAAEFNA